MEFKIFTLLVILPIIHGLSTPSSTSYKAGVVEFHPSIDKTNELNLEANLAEYLKFIDTAATEELDILVFPEYTLNAGSFVTLPEKGNETNPCNQQFEEGPIKKVSCAAKKNKVYVIINVTERSKCGDQEKECPADGFVFYNSNVVFDRNGTIISKYRKSHLFMEPDIFTPKNPEAVTFDTDFGVKFGHFICFDMVFYDPAVKLVKELGVTDIVYPTMWFNELYSGIAIPYQHYWAYANDVNLLAAGANNPMYGSTGSGIYAGKMGTITSYITGLNSTKLLTAVVPKKPRTGASFKDETLPSNPQQLAGLTVFHEDLSAYETQLIPKDKTSFETKICQPDPKCCHFDLEFTREDYPNFPEITDYQYRAAFFSGNRTFQGQGFGVVTACLLMACRNAAIESCGLLFDDYTNVANLTTFSKINIKATFETDKKDVVTPYTLSYSLLPLPLDQFDYSQKENTFEMVAKTNLTKILGFGVVAQHFNGSESLTMSSILLIVSFILSILRY